MAQKFNERLFIETHIHPMIFHTDFASTCSIIGMRERKKNAQKLNIENGLNVEESQSKRTHQFLLTMEPIIKYVNNRTKNDEFQKNKIFFTLH